MRLILASTSRYRRDMMARLGLPFACQPPEVDETPLAGERPRHIARRLARAKAMAVAARRPGSLIVGADQVASLDGEPVGKPGNLDRARDQLRRLAGHRVDFHSGLCVTDGKRQELACVKTACRFRALSASDIDTYLEREQPFDTAGSAKAEGLGIALMDAMTSDDPTAIIGLPLIALCRLLRSFGMDPLR